MRDVLPPKPQAAGDSPPQIRLLPVIVAEVSRNWKIGTLQPGEQRHAISADFEAVIDANQARGYALRDWRLTQTWVPFPEPHLVETIVAVFELRYITITKDSGLGPSA